MNYYSTIAFLHFMEYILYRYFYSKTNSLSLKKKTYLDVMIINSRTGVEHPYAKIVLQDIKLKDKLIKKVYDALTVSRAEDEKAYVKFKEYRDDNDILDTDSYVLNFTEYKTNYAYNITKRKIEYKNILLTILMLSLFGYILGFYILLVLIVCHFHEIWYSIK